MSTHASRTIIALAAVATLAVAACSSGGSSANGAGSPTAAPADASAVTASPGASASAAATPADADTVDHPTGATDIVLRVSERGGFIRMDYAMGRLPSFTLYGDGRVLLVPPATASKGLPGAAEAVPVLREARLTEPEVQAILRFALTEGGLGLAKEQYAGMMMDLPTTVFEVNAGGVTKTVSAGGLSAEPEPGPDAATLRALAMLAERLRTLATTADYVPPAWVAILAETEPNPAGPAPSPWPWPELAPAAFVQPADADPIPFPKALLTQAQAEAAGVDPATGGTAGLQLTGPDGKLYIVAIRPALPEEAAGG